MFTEPSGGDLHRRIEGRLKDLWEESVRFTVSEYRDGGGISAFRAGGILGFSVAPEDRESFVSLMRLAEEENFPSAVIGAGSNLLITDGYHEGLFLLTGRLCRFRIEENGVFCEAGTAFSALSASMEKQGLSLGEELAGIPGTLGGMLAMNASAYGRAIGDMLISAEVYDIENKKIIRLGREEMQFSYRDSILHHRRYVLLSALLEGRCDSPENIRERREHYRALRRESQPLGTPSLGCYFKRNAGRSPGAIIDACGLKGLSVGGAAVSEKHAAFLINRGGATASDLLALAEKVKKTVCETSGILLEEEVKIL